jgi:IPT/TIG domain
VTVRGTRFTGVLKVRFGTRRGTHVYLINSGELKVTAPAGTGTVNVTVTTSGGTSRISRKDRYHYK